MDLGKERMPAAGGNRTMPAPDPIARDYLVLALRLGKLLPGLVEAYFGPAELQAQVEAEDPTTPARLREEASSLDARLKKEIDEPDRQRWLQAQLVALEAQALMLTGDPLAYTDWVTCLLDLTPERTPDSVFESAADDLAKLLPSGEMRTETVADRLAAWNERFKIDPERLPAVVDWLAGMMRDKADRLFGLPHGEQVEFAYVAGGPWSAFNQYEGHCRTVVEVNTDLVCRPADLIHMVARSCYPGRHTEHAWKERRLAGELGRLEASVSLLNTPATVISEGLSYLGERLVVPDETMAGLLIELFERGGLAIAADRAAAADAADKQMRIRKLVASLRAVSANAAFMLHADGASRELVAMYLHRYLLTSRERADKRLSLIESDPIFRAQFIVGHEGEQLLRRWFELGPTSEQVDRYGRLLREQLTPGWISADLSSTGFGPGGW
jgi:hypothetical protein